jgi:putative MATE family efflux protein
LAFTASGICVPIIYIVFALSELVSTGIVPRVGRLLGCNNRSEAEHTLGAFFILDIVLALIICLTFETFTNELVTLFGGDDMTSPLAVTYLRIAAPGYALNIVAAGLTPFLLADGRSRLASTILGAGIGLNILLDPLFIFGFGWGIAGAAWATTISGLTSAVLAIAYTLENRELQLHRSNLHLEWRLMRPCLSLGLTPMVLVLAETLQLGVYNHLLLKLGGDMAIGAMTMVVMLFDFFYFPVYGMAFGAQPVTSYNLGAGQYNRIFANVRLLLKVTLVWSLAVWVLMVFFTTPVVSLILGNVPLSSYAAPLVRLSFVVFFAATLQFVCQSTLQALNHPKTTFWLGLSQTLLLLLPLVALLPRLFPSYATQSVFLARPIVDVLMCILTFNILYKCMKQIKISSI